MPPPPIRHLDLDDGKASVPGAEQMDGMSDQDLDFYVVKTRTQVNRSKYAVSEFQVIGCSSVPTAGLSALYIMPSPA